LYSINIVSLLIYLKEGCIEFRCHWSDNTPYAEECPKLNNDNNNNNEFGTVTCTGRNLQLE